LHWVETFLSQLSTPNKERIAVEKLAKTYEFFERSPPTLHPVIYPLAHSLNLAMQISFTHLFTIGKGGTLNPALSP
jgi:hypothetical protein